MNSGKIVADGWTDGRTGGGSIRGPRGPKNISKEGMNATPQGKAEGNTGSQKRCRDEGFKKTIHGHNMRPSLTYSSNQERPIS